MKVKWALFLLFILTTIFRAVFLLQLATLTITVLDFNDHDPSFDKSENHFKVLENTTTITSFGSVFATDADEANIITYSIP